MSGSRMRLLIEIDLVRGTAEWHSMMGSESLELAAAAAPPRVLF
jgi:hypothetical protein